MFFVNTSIIYDISFRQLATFVLSSTAHVPSLDAVVSSMTDATPSREMYPWFARVFKPGQGPRMSLGPGAICAFDG
jgi:hypothetical protein